MLQGWRLKVSKLFIIPQRYILGAMGFFAIVNAYTMRICLSLTITEMVVPLNDTEVYDHDSCPADTPDNITVAAVKDFNTLYDWDEKTQGLILSSFYYGYIITHIPGGILAEKFGGKYSLGLGILSTAIFTLITPWVILSTNGNWKVLVALRMIEGLGEGTTYPALTTLMAKWVPLNERATIGSVVFAGSQIGTVLANLFSGWLIKLTASWTSVFYFFGILGLLWYVVWQLLCYSTPDDHPFISDEEREYLQKELSGVSKEEKDIPWRKIFTSVPVWCLVVSQAGQDWGFFTMVTDLPKYMKDVLRFSVEQNGIWSSVPYIVMWFVSIGGGYVCDYLVNKRVMTVTWARKLFSCLSCIGPAVFIILASYSGCDRMLAVWMFTLGVSFMGFYFCGMKVNAIDLSPNFAGTIMAIINGIGSLSGMIAPYLVGVLTGDHTLAQWRTVFWITFVILMSSNVVYLLWGSGVEQLWNDPRNNLSSNDRKEKIEKDCQIAIGYENGEG